ncbi:MAG: tRNA (adenosine(37)-N6)-threonylcarbamoyltransferase complex dimerization subunit type 1 TsaB [Coleofasciculaceae cyanobacterium SM2_3_26]|nr:tRNA (adenosine(37)-N6)-threonylcarbamoyltransferase complex dimerization subunit type 1 TsaB [Coleofasciculaceae cyanobacterium SM2_3_26]
MTRLHQNSHRNYGLALHTTSPELGFAISNFDGDRRCQTWDLGKEMSSLLHVYLSKFLPPQTWENLAFLAVAKGPGSFTGTRIGMVTARTLAQQLHLPLFAISTTAAIAQQQRHANPTIPPHADIAVQMPAQRNQLFTAIYKPCAESGGLTTLLPDTARTWDAWQDILNAWTSPYYLILAPSHHGSSTLALLDLAYGSWKQGKRPHWEEALPYYGQHPVHQN